MEILDSGVRVVCLCLAVLMGIAAIHKIQVLVRGLSDMEPMLHVTEWHQRHAVLLLAAALIAELATAASLVVVPVVGLGASLALLGIYSWHVRRLAPDESCNCFGNFLRDGRVSAMRRNLILGAPGAAAFVAVVTGALQAAPISQATAGTALILTMIGASGSLLRDIGRRGGAAAERRARQEGGWFAG
jgi:hypothetical protein